MKKNKTMKKNQVPQVAIVIRKIFEIAKAIEPDSKPRVTLEWLGNGNYEFDIQGVKDLEKLRAALTGSRLQ
jgi:hypothetical protein